MPDLTDPVWCGKFTRVEAGTLSLTGGQLRFDTEERCVFNVPRSAIERIIWHWYSFSGAFEAKIGGQDYFLSFVPRYATLGGSWYRGLAAGHRWRAALEGRPAPTHGPLGPRVFVILMTIVAVFLMGCFALLGLGMAIDPQQSRFDRIGGGFMILGAIASVAKWLWPSGRSRAR